MPSSSNLNHLESRQNILISTESKSKNSITNESPPPPGATVNETLAAHQFDCAEDMLFKDDENLVTEQEQEQEQQESLLLKKEKEPKKDSSGGGQRQKDQKEQKKKEDEEITTEKRDRDQNAVEKEKQGERGRSKSKSKSRSRRHAADEENQKGEEAEAEAEAGGGSEKEEAEGEGEPFKFCGTTPAPQQEISHNRNPVPSFFSLRPRPRPRGLSRSISKIAAVSSWSKRKLTREGDLSMSDDDDDDDDDRRRGHFEEEVIDDASLQPASSEVVNENVVFSSTTEKKLKWMEKYHYPKVVVSLWRYAGRTARIVYDGARSGLSLFVAFFLKYLVMFLNLVLFISIAHRAICEIPLIKYYYHSSCTAVWAPTPLSTDAKQDYYALSRIAEPLQRHTETLNQLQQGNEYFQELTEALFQSSQWMRSMRAVLLHTTTTSVEIPSKEQTIIKELERYVMQSEETSQKLSELWTKIPATVHLVLLERQALVKNLEGIRCDADDIDALTAILDVPLLLWSFVASPLLGRHVLTPYQARQVNDERARLAQLKFFFPRFRDRLDRLAVDILTARNDFGILNSSVHKIQSLLLDLDISHVSTSRDLLSRADAHPYRRRFRAFLGLRTTQSFDLLRTREAQLHLLSTTNATVTITIRELTIMANLVQRLSNDMSSILENLDHYERPLDEGKLSVDGLLRAVQVGIDALARGRVSHLEKQKERSEEESRESDEGFRKAVMELRNLVDKFH